MFKGSIELVTPESVSGWIWCEMASLRDCTVLAFVDGRCIGSGTVAGFRSDLYDAGMGDGHCGFSFPIAIPNGTDSAAIYVRLEKSDFSLFQRGSDPTAPVANAYAAWRDPTIEWMLPRGWLSQDDASFLGAMRDVGVAVAPLPSAGGKSPKGWAADRLGLLLQKDVSVRQTRLSGTEMDEILSVRQAGVACLLPQRTYRRKIFEGSHLPSRSLEQAPVIYRAGPHQVLFIDRMCASESVSDVTSHDIELIEVAA